MTCDSVRSELVGYHLGAVEPSVRDALDGHLLECRGCLGRYLAVKRALEDGELPDALPSPELRARIRADVAAQLAPARVLRPNWLWGVAAGAAAGFALAFVLNGGLHRRAPPRSAIDAPLIDSEAAESGLKVL